MPAQQQQLEVARRLIDAGATVDAVNAHRITPVSTAVFSSRGNGDLIDLLRSRVADPQHANNGGVSPVDLARLIGNYDVEQFFADLD